MHRSNPSENDYSFIRFSYRCKRKGFYLIDKKIIANPNQNVVTDNGVLVIRNVHHHEYSPENGI